jgi:hypothetical protein
VDEHDHRDVLALVVGGVELGELLRPVAVVDANG